ncbi:MAG: elongation factor P 5-aminopentanone reductase [Candidatus Onthoplasma sp.]
MKTILITGASGGIGSAIAKKLANSETNLILIYNKSERNIKKLKQELEKICPVQIFQCDLTKEKEIKNMVDNAIKTQKKIDVLINACGISHFQQIQDTTEKDFYKVIDNNLKSYVLTSAIVSKHMIHEQNGKIINISSMWGNVGASMESLYSLTKGAINNLTLSLAKELGPSNITVNAICPGLIDTKMNKNLDKSTIEEIVKNTPISRIGKPEDVASLVKFLSSEDANFITGQIITIDGGYSL